jgi:antitoxin component of RelBE/YafQ-DinJ toxin-antitoxin module
MKTSYIHIRIESDIKKKFDEVTKKSAVNQSALVRKWVIDYIKMEDKLKVIILDKNFKQVGHTIDFKVEYQGKEYLLHENDWNTERYLVEGVSFYPVYEGIGAPDEEGEYADYRIVGFDAK